MGGERDEAAIHRRLLECSPVVTFIVDATGRIGWVNDAVTALGGYARDEVVGTNILDYFDPAADPRAFESIGAAMNGKGLRRPMLFRLLRNDGTSIVCEVTANAQMDDPIIDGLAVYLRRWDERVLLDEIVETIAASSPLRTTLDLVVAIIASETLESDGAVLYEPGQTGFGQVVAGAGLDPTLSGLVEGSAVPGPWSEALATRRLVVCPVRDLPDHLRRPAEAAGYGICWAWPVPDLSGGTVAACLVVWRRDDEAPDHTCTMAMERLVRLTGLVLDRERSVATLQHAANHDPLTDLPDRAVFYDEMQSLLDGPDEGRLVGLLYVDLDDFKPINDELGHRAGDDVLVEVAARLSSAVRHGDLVARLGGDEFAVVCRSVESLDDLAALAERIATRVTEPLPGLEGHRLGVSIGISGARPGSATSDAVVDAADGALRVVKADGKGGWQIGDVAGPDRFAK